MSSTGPRLARRRAKLHAENPNCPQCGKVMVLSEDGGTIAQSPLKAVLYRTDIDGIPGTILMCFKCCTLVNAKRNFDALGIEGLRKASSKHTKCVCPTCGTEHLKQDDIDEQRRISKDALLRQNANKAIGVSQG